METPCYNPYKVSERPKLDCEKRRKTERERAYIAPPAFNNKSNGPILHHYAIQTQYLPTVYHLKSRKKETSFKVGQDNHIDRNSLENWAGSSKQ
ncbi:unnamed protein product [Dovyalis caffra]|uniref:Uncharacterized protein n=1 Tax=Dovyalis caffra TaxID=77055 RepID=A0AAV1SG23_9ROSI|nr:unnamed protein product [Dovyalis caffra]